MTACIIMKRHSKHLKQLGILFSLVLCVISNYSCSGGTNKFRLSEDCQQIDSFKNLVLQVFLENSGSMNGYMIAGSEFKDAVYDLASALSSRCDTTELFFVNSMISMYSQSLESFVRDMSPQLFQQFPGNRMNSDLADVIAQVIAKTDSNRISMLVSDFILDVPNGPVLSIKQTQVRNAVKRKIVNDKDFSVVILHLESKYCGKFNGVLQNLHRPYYIWLMGNKYLLGRLLAKEQPEDIQHGIRHQCAFTPDAPLACVIASGAATESLRSSSRRSAHFVELKMDLCSTLQPQAYILSPVNYDTRGNNGITVEKVCQLAKADSCFTHLITLKIPNRIKPCADGLLLKAQTLPLWVDSINQDYVPIGKHIPDRTIGIRNLIQGVSDAYKEVSSCGHVDFTISAH